jgi:hypothetical protein
MRNQSLLVALLLVIVASVCHSLPADNDDKIDAKENDIVSDHDKFKPDPKVPKALDPRFNKMLPMPALNGNQLDAAVKAEKAHKSQKSSTTEKSAKHETSTIGEQIKSQFFAL